MCRIWAKANPSPIRDDIRILNGQQWKSLLVDIYGLFKMCGLYVEVIEDSIDARGEFFQRSSYYQHSLSSCASSRFLCFRLGGGLDRGGGGRLLWHNNIYQTRITLQNMAKHIRHRHMHKSKSLWCANQYFTWMRLTGGAQLYLPSSALSDYWANRRCQIGLNFCFCKNVNETGAIISSRIRVQEKQI